MTMVLRMAVLEAMVMVPEAGTVVTVLQLALQVLVPLLEATLASVLLPIIKVVTAVTAATAATVATTTVLPAL
jgi:hypothetical protein